ncbi:MAG: hypothetical protein Q4F00_12505 [bacterium]|nr:hypothetical protein [bacterium]
MIPAVLGRNYQDALRLARRYGRGPERVLLTCPPWPVIAAGELRVVGCRSLESGETWILAYSDYVRIKADGA